MTDTSTQNATLLRHLNEGASITALQALKQYGVGHLARRILDLKERGHPIDSQFIKVMKANGQTARVKEYYLRSSQ